MADRKISDLTALTTPASGDFLPIVDISEAAAASKNKKITYSDFLNNIPTGTITSTMILDGTILNADINASAAIVDTKLATIATGGKVSNSATTATDANTASAIVARDGSGNFTAGTITANLTGTASNVTTNANLTGDVTSVGNATSIAAGVIVNADINASAAIALSKLATGALPSGITVASANIVNSTIVNTDISASAAIVDTKLATIATAGKVSNSATTATDANTASAIVARDGSGNFTAGTITAALTGAASSNVLKAGDTMTGALVVPLASAATPSLTFTGDLDSGVFSPGANQVAVATNGTGRLFVSSTGTVGIDTNETGFNGQGLPLIVGNGSGNLGLTIYSGNNNFGTVQFADTAATGADSYRGVVAYKHGDEYMYFSTNATEKLRIDSSGRLLVGTGSDSGGALFQVNGDRIRVGTAKTPATSGATGTTGEIAWDADYIYVCTATNTWKRSAIATW
jgi:trimeric autotransporter adhesin